MSLMSMVDNWFSLRSWTNMLAKTGDVDESTALWARRSPSEVRIVRSVWIDSESMRERHRRLLRLARDCSMHSSGHIGLGSPPWIKFAKDP